MNRFFVITSLLLGLSSSLTTVAQERLHVTSPDGRHEVEFYLKPTGDGISEIRYSVNYDGKSVILDSRAGLQTDNRVWECALGHRTLEQPRYWTDNFVLDSIRSFPAVDDVWHPLFGERSTIRNAYNSATMYLSKRDGSDYALNIEVRAYDEGVAFRYFLPEHPWAVFHKIVGDLTEYTFEEGAAAWTEKWAQAPFERLPINDITEPVERPLTVELPNGLWAALADADTDDWCLTKFVADGSGENRLTSVMYSPVDVVTYYATPWKIVMTAETVGGLAEHNYIIDNLNPPCEIADTSWIEPGKIMRETTLTTAGAEKTIDFCAAHGIRYMLFDWKWYVPCTSHDGDATQVVPSIDMPHVVEYGRERGVGIWLYVNQHALMKQMRELFPLLHEWGVAGVKSGFVQYASHRWAVWLHDMVRLAAENRLMMNIHDEYRPSGFSRTYPNLLTQEGIHGNEEFPSAEHNTILPFTRMLCGAADYTICYFDPRLKNTHAHQLALSVLYYSPLVTLYWYDYPARIAEVPELEFFDRLPTVWDDMKVLDDAIGRHTAIARRSGDEWFAGAIASDEACETVLATDFLDEDKAYHLRIYTDDASVATPTSVGISDYIIRRGDSLPLRLAARGGAAMHFKPATKEDLKSYKAPKRGKFL